MSFGQKSRSSTPSGKGPAGNELKDKSRPISLWFLFGLASALTLWLLPVATSYHYPVALAVLPTVAEVITWVMVAHWLVTWYFKVNDNKKQWGVLLFICGAVAWFIDNTPLFSLSLDSVWVQVTLSVMVVFALVVFNHFSKEDPCGHHHTSWVTLMPLSLMLMLASATLVVLPMMSHTHQWSLYSLYILFILSAGFVYHKLVLHGGDKTKSEGATDYALVIVPVYLGINTYMLIRNLMSLNSLPQLTMVYDDLLVILGVLLIHACCSGLEDEDQAQANLLSTERASSRQHRCQGAGCPDHFMQQSQYCVPVTTPITSPPPPPPPPPPPTTTSLLSFFSPSLNGPVVADSRLNATMSSPNLKQADSRKTSANQYIAYVLPAMLVLMPVTAARYLAVNQSYQALNGSLAVFFLLCPCVFLSTDRSIREIQDADKQTKATTVRNTIIGSYVTCMAGLNLWRPMNDLLCVLTPALCFFLYGIIARYASSVNAEKRAEVRPEGGTQVDGSGETSKEIMEDNDQRRGRQRRAQTDAPRPTNCLASGGDQSIGGELMHRRKSMNNLHDAESSTRSASGSRY